MNSNLSNSENLLIEILRIMYEDNISQINSMTNSINNIRQTNSHIRNSLFEIIYSSNNNRTNFRNNNINRINVADNTTNNVTDNTNTQNIGRIILDNIPYVVENIQQYTIPLTQQNSNLDRNNMSRLIQNFLQPVQIYPTQLQIELSTRNVQYCDIVNPINRCCPISLEIFNDNDMVSVIRFCGHIFKQDQLTRWFRSNCKCPVCRYDIRNYNTNTSTNTSTNIDATEPLIDIIGENVSSIPNQDTNNTLNNYFDLFLDETLINEISNLSNSTDINNNLSRFFSTLQRRMS